MKTTTILVSLVLALVSCDFKKMEKSKNEANLIFADQYFKTAIAHIELYNIRHGNYPLHLDSLDFVSEFDKAAFASVSYAKLDKGYQLDILNGPIDGSPVTLQYPKEFWQGLGLKQSNLLKDRVPTQK